MNNSDPKIQQTPSSLSKTTFSRAEFEEIKEQLHSQKFLILKVITGSMEPIIKTGTNILVEPIVRPPKLNDIIVFLRKNVMVCHYLVHKNQIPDGSGQDVFITRNYGGDEDLPILRNDILGLVTSHSLNPIKQFLFNFKNRLLRRRKGLLK